MAARGRPARARHARRTDRRARRLADGRGRPSGRRLHAGGRRGRAARGGGGRRGGHGPVRRAATAPA
eukprot:3999221-Prymnesium_polylepis.1